MFNEKTWKIDKSIRSVSNKWNVSHLYFPIHAWRIKPKNKKILHKYKCIISFVRKMYRVWASTTTLDAFISLPIFRRSYKTICTHHTLDVVVLHPFTYSVSLTYFFCFCICHRRFFYPFPVSAFFHFTFLMEKKQPIRGGGVFCFCFSVFWS